MEFSVLSNNLKMPMMGFGVFQVTDKNVCKQSVLNAIRTGYRLIDTAAVYGNEDAVGEAVREAISEGLCTRDELFITSKLWVQDMLNQDTAAAGIEASLKKSGLEYFDLYLLHQAMRDYFSAWRALEDAYEEGKLKAIGVSNFYPHVLANFCETVRVKPMVNQVELHPYFAQPEALATMKYYNVQPEAWAPLGGGRHKPFENNLLQSIADAHQKSISQVILRWNIQREVVVIPKSTHQQRIEENFAIWDFSLTEKAVAVELLSIRIDVTFQDEALYFLAISAMVSSRTVGDADTDETLICFRIILSSALVENAITPDNSVANKTDFLNI
ncbi:aldo/keto reductase [Escherichia coli O111:NM str. 2011C-3362]|nr:aldo/keto reductase [Escherichia coli O111:NM str. 2011C-3362]